MPKTYTELLKEAKASIREVNPQEAERLRAEGVTFIDVRETSEWDQGYIPGALHVARRSLRPLPIPGVGSAGQARLLESKVLLSGAGGLGSPAALYLAAAGVGTIGIVDFDVVEASNLQRQVIHSTERLGEKKVDSARTTIQALNPDVQVVTHDEMLVADNVDRLIAGYDVILDGTDT